MSDISSGIPDSGSGTDSEHGEVLRGIPLFNELSEDELRTIQSHAVMRSYRKNTIIIEKGDETNSLYVVVSGKVKVFVDDEDGKELVLNTMGAGAYFGELALLGNTTRTASVMTLENSRLLVISQMDFLNCVRASPEIALELIRHLIDKISNLTDRLGTLALRDVYGRVAAALKEQAQEEDGRLITGRLTQQDLAHMVGASREMISRILKDLKLGGYVDVQNKRIVILKKLPARW